LVFGSTRGVDRRAVGLKLGVAGGRGEASSAGLVGVQTVSHQAGLLVIIRGDGPYRVAQAAELSEMASSADE
jgi:hypothetical protein